MSRCLRFAAVGLLLLSLAVPVRAADWTWSFAPYLWGAGVNLDVTANNEPVLGADVSFSDLLDKTEIAGMVHFEGRRGRGGFFVDALFLAVEDEQTTSGGPVAPPGTLVESEVDFGIYEAGGFFRLTGNRHGLDLLFGARLTDVDQQHRITPPLPSTVVATLEPSSAFTDAFVGLRYTRALGERWGFLVRGDVGAGDTELTWNASGLASVAFGPPDRYTLLFGYRHMAMETEDDSDRGILVETETQLSGPIVGFVFGF